MLCQQIVIFFFNDTPTTEISTLSLHAALPIYTTHTHTHTHTHTQTTQTLQSHVMTTATFNLNPPLCLEQRKSRPAEVYKFKKLLIHLK